MFNVKAGCSRWLLGLVINCCATLAAAQNYVVAGSAYSLENHKLVYRELYTAMDENHQLRVDYVTPNGNTFATKTLSYQGAYFQPEFDYFDQRDSEHISAQFEGPKLKLVHAIGDSRREKIIYNNANLVVDAGFDAFIQLNWDKLVANKSLSFDFAFPARMDVVALRVERIGAGDSPLYDKNYGVNWIYFRIKPAGFLTGLIAAPIYLAYEPNGKYLMRFQGRSNIDDDRGAPLDVRIEYEYSN